MRFAAAVMTNLASSYSKITMMTKTVVIIHPLLFSSGVVKKPPAVHCSPTQPVMLIAARAATSPRHYTAFIFVLSSCST